MTFTTITLAKSSASIPSHGFRVIYAREMDKRIQSTQFITGFGNSIFASGRRRYIENFRQPFILPHQRDRHIVEISSHHQYHVP